MDKIENQAYLTNFILESSAELVEVSQENPALYNALIDAFAVMSNEFGTGETKMEKVEEVKVVDKIEISEKKKRGRKRPLAPYELTIDDINKMDEAELNSAINEIPSYLIKRIADLTFAGTPVTNEISPEKRAIPKNIDFDKAPVVVVYDTTDARDIQNVIKSNSKMSYSVWILMIYNGYFFFVDENGNKIDLDTSIIAPVGQPAEPKPESVSTSGLITFNIPDGKGGIEVIYLTSDTPTLRYKISEEDLISKGNLLFSKNSRQIIDITDVGKVSFEADFADENGDIFTSEFDKKVFLDNVQVGTWLLVKPTGKDQMGIRTFNVFGIDLIKSTAKKPKKQATPEELAALQLELESAELLAEIGDADAIKEVTKLKKKIAKLKA